MAAPSWSSRNRYWRTPPSIAPLFRLCQLQAEFEARLGSRGSKTVAAAMFYFLQPSLPLEQVHRSARAYGMSCLHLINASEQL